MEDTTFMVSVKPITDHQLKEKVMAEMLAMAEKFQLFVLGSGFSSTGCPRCEDSTDGE